MFDISINDKKVIWISWANWGLYKLFLLIKLLVLRAIVGLGINLICHG